MKYSCCRKILLRELMKSDYLDVRQDFEWPKYYRGNNYSREISAQQKLRFQKDPQRHCLELYEGVTAVAHS